MELKNKLKIYLDTSVVSYLSQNDSPLEMQYTLELWERFKAGFFDVNISQVGLSEIYECNEPKKSILKSKLEEIKYNVLKVDNDTYNLANEIVEKKILTEKSFDDCTHIAVAIQNNCDIILSWNFKHMVNIKTIQGVRKITSIKGYNSVEIMNPKTFFELGGTI